MSWWAFLQQAPTPSIARCYKLALALRRALLQDAKLLHKARARPAVRRTDGLLLHHVSTADPISKAESSTKRRQWCSNYL